MAAKSILDNQFTVDATWDDEAEVWVAESGEIPGLITEAESRVKLNKKLSGSAPELLEVNGCKFDPAKPIDLLIRYNRPAEKREERIRVPKAA